MTGAGRVSTLPARGPARPSGGSLRAVPNTPPTVRDLAARHHLELVAHGSSGADAQVTGVTLDSRRVEPGQLYAALPGSTTHGARFAGQVVAAGAVALLTDAAGAATVTGQLGADAPPLLLSEDPRASLGPLAADVHGHPSSALALVGVTGTNGKTTVSTLVDGLLRAVGVRTGLIGTIRSRIAEEELASSFTTPEAPDLQALLRRMVEAGCTAATTEVSSHALAQHRVDGTRFALAVFTNLSRDHLDFHGTVENYFAAKLRLFTDGFAPAAVVAVDDRWGHEVARASREAGLRLVTVASHVAGHVTSQAPGDVASQAPGDVASDHVADADVVVEVLRVHPSGAQDVEVRGLPGGAVRLGLGMPGAFNAMNAALALTAVHLLLTPGPGTPPAVDLGRPVEAAGLAARLGEVGGVPGRMERVVRPGAPLVVVDYAHTPDAVAGAVAALRPATPGRLVVVLGAGGDRDQGKRAAMGEAASAADLVVVTDDNPRNEDPAAIRAAVLAGVRAEVLEVGDRAEAVAAALAACTGPDDTVLLAGKGHETGQRTGSTTAPFDDREVARDALARWAADRGAGPGADHGAAHAADRVGDDGDTDGGAA